jgi:hypothetical protein
MPSPSPAASVIFFSLHFNVIPLNAFTTVTAIINKS